MESWRCPGGGAFAEALRKLMVLTALVGLVCACQDEGSLPALERGPEPPSREVYFPDPPPDLCRRRILDVEARQQPSPTPTLDAHRAELLARARSVPVLFLKRPEPPLPTSPRVKKLRSSLEKAEDPVHAILEVLRRTRGDFPLRRQVFLSDHYLYAETPLLALRLSQVLRLDHLFSKAERELVIERGTETITVTRKEGQYFLPPVPDANPNKRHHVRLASLLLFDRVRTADDTFGPPLHVDLRPLQRKLGFSRARITARSEDALVAELSIYGTLSRAVLNWEGTKIVLECETRDKTPLSDLATARLNYHRDQELISPVLEAAHEMIFRQLPFDEPKTEEGQQDGLLRMHFKQAYQHYASTYEFNGDSYYIFDGYGRPRLPQVCIDFITDAFDWGTGGRWPARGEKREYVRGALNFASMGMENARSVENLADFASEHPEWFDVLWLPKEERVKFRQRTKFFEHLARHASLYRRGDIVFIYGLRDDGKFHYHSFLIDELDPVTGMPILVLANAGPPQARSWEGEMQNAPGRSIVARVRVRREILRRAHEQRERFPGVPLTFPSKKEAQERGIEPEISPPLSPIVPQPQLRDSPEVTPEKVPALPSSGIVQDDSESGLSSVLSGPAPTGAPPPLPASSLSDNELR